MSLEVGQIIDGKYRIVRLIGEGGMGAVYEGENAVIRRRVAIKVLHAHAAAQAATVLRFEREAQAAGRIGSDHILEVLDLGSLPSNERYMVLEFLDGETLGARVSRLGRLRPADVCPLALQMLAGLGAAHRAGIVHRDLKPDNVFILREKAGQRDFVKLIDFGISKFNQAGGDMSMTSTGSVLGTPYYMSPEQASGSRDADARSDLYAVGVILFECVTGRVPFDANTFNELLFKIVLAEPPKLAELAPDIDPAFAAIVGKAMSRDAAFRFQSSEELADALRRYQISPTQIMSPATGIMAASPAPVVVPQSEPPALPIKKGPGRAVVVAAIVFALAAVAGAVVLLRKSAEPTPETPVPSAESPQAAPLPPVVEGQSSAGLPVTAAPAASAPEAPPAEVASAAPAAPVAAKKLEKGTARAPESRAARRTEPKPPPRETPRPSPAPGTPPPKRDLDFGY